ncbi:lysine-rich arabinogalactan protein 19-like [Diospyros lotus]|uniref:lysine-rich arabinogalactan protein 19-like n=1 Tax=Diospyros lotus TaxID=55363 RepID=UPI0022564185|nr:lysine-rich arabinogalactan protein 19-like [Diospyros lotus]
MARQQPPALPWFRLASVSRPTRAPTTASAPPQAQALPVSQPRPSIIRPTLTQSSSNTPTQPAQPPLARPTQAPTPLPVAASPPVPASKSPPPQAETAPPATAFPRNPTTPPPRATAPPPAQAQKSPPQGRGKSKDKSYKAMNNSSPPMSAFMNSNVQGVNNSILYNCSYRHHDPGVHCSLYQKANGHGNGIKPNNEERASGIW